LGEEAGRTFLDADPENARNPSTDACVSARLSRCQGSQRPRNELDRLVDVVVADIEVGDRAQPRWMRGHRQAHSLLPEPLERFFAGQPERRELDLNEVRLDLLEVDGNAGG